MTAERRLPYVGAATMAEWLAAERFLLDDVGLHPGRLTNRTPDEVIAWARDAGMTPIRDR
jgi:hypothetical protein